MQFSGRSRGCQGRGSLWPKISSFSCSFRVNGPNNRLAPPQGLPPLIQEIQDPPLQQIPTFSQDGSEKQSNSRQMRQTYVTNSFLVNEAKAHSHRYRRPRWSGRVVAIMSLLVLSITVADWSQIIILCWQAPASLSFERNTKFQGLQYNIPPGRSSGA